MANRSIAFCHAERPIDSRRCREYERAGFGLVAVRGGSVSWPGGGRCVGVRLRAAVRSAVALAALLALFVPSPARGATWTPVQMPNVTDHPDSDLAPGQPPPYRLDWPGEGRSDTGEQDPACGGTAPYRNGRRVRADGLSGVL